MTSNQRIFEQELKRLQRSINRLTKQENFIQTFDLPTQPKRVTKKRIKQLQELKGRQFVSEIDIQTGEVIRQAEYEDIYKSKPRQKSYGKKPYDPDKARAYREAHREQIREANRRYREANKEKIAERQRAYRQAHKEQIRERQRAYRQANRRYLNFQARRRRAQKKLEAQNMRPTSTSFSIYDELILRFTEAKQEAINHYPYYLPAKLSAIEHLIGLLELQKEEMGMGAYAAYLKANEDTLGHYMDELIKASDQPNLETWESNILRILNATGIEIPRETLADFATATESGGY